MKITKRLKNTIFPTYVFEIDVADYDKELLKTVVSEGILLRTDPLSLTKSTLDKDERLDEFKQFVLDIHQDILVTLGYSGQELEFAGMWGVEQKKHGYHRQHYHPNNWMCGVFYIDTHEDDTIVFHDPRLRAGLIQPKTQKYNEFNTSINKFSSPEGKLYIFPGWLEHSVEPLTHDKTRVSMSWNIAIPKHLGCGYGCTNG